MAIFKKKTAEETVKELKKEIESLKLQRNLSAEKRALKKELLMQKLGRATDIIKEIYHGGKAFQKEISKAYTPTNEKKVRNMKKVLFGD